MYQRKRPIRDEPANSDAGLTAGQPSPAAGTVEAVGDGAPNQSGGGVPSSSDTQPDARSLLLRLEESENAVRLHLENAKALQRQLEMRQGGRQLSDEQMLDMRKASDRREEFTEGRQERAAQFLAANKHLDIDQLGKAHESLMLGGYVDESEAYHRALEKQFGELKRILPPGALEDERNPDVSYGAPVSRSEAPNFGSGGRGHDTKVKLSPDEREAAAYSGVSETDYARQKIKMEDYKRRGLIQDTGGR
jgi:hypothetical protein